MDEIEHLDVALERLDELVNVGRGVNYQAIISLQSVAQLYDTYSENRGKAIKVQPNREHNPVVGQSIPIRLSGALGRVAPRHKAEIHQLRQRVMDSSAVSPAANEPLYAVADISDRRTAPAALIPTTDDRHDGDEMMCPLDLIEGVNDARATSLVRIGGMWLWWVGHATPKRRPGIEPRRGPPRRGEK